MLEMDRQALLLVCTVLFQNAHR